LILVGMWFTAAKYINVETKKDVKILDKQTETDWESYWKIIQKPVFGTYILGMSGIIYISGGLQFWGTNYLISLHTNGNGADLSESTIGMIFSVLAVTGAIGGAVVGGWLADRYANPQMLAKEPLALQRAWCAVIPGIIAAIPCVLTLYSASSLIAFVVQMWFILFFGAMTYPVSQAGLLTEVGDENHVAASKFYMGVTAIIGNGLNNILSGEIMSRSSEKIGDDLSTTKEAVGWKATMFGVFPAMMMMLLTTYLIWRRQKPGESQESGCCYGKQWYPCNRSPIKASDGRYEKLSV